jgi:hypothetical protein
MRLRRDQRRIVINSTSNAWFINHATTADIGYVPPNGKAWVDHIRKKGNEANHEIVLMKKEDSQELISFVEMLLKFIYEFPNRVPKSTAAVPPQAGTATP